MSKYKQLKQTHPQKYYLEMICQVIYYLGGGNCWYTEKAVSKTVKIIYRVLSLSVSIYAFVVYANQLLSSFRPLTFKEKNDVFQFDISNLLILSKFVVLYLQKKRIKVLLERFLEEDREFASLELEKLAVKKAFRYWTAIQIFLCATVLSYLVDGIVMHFKEGIPIRTEVVYYPSPQHSGVFVNILRFFVEAHGFYIVAMMTCIDGLSVSCMVFLSYKFRYLTEHFHGLGVKLEANMEKMRIEDALKQYKKEFINGIKLHEHALSYSKQIQHAVGNLYSIQVVKSMFLLSVTLFKLMVNTEHSSSITSLMASIFYMTCCGVELGGYMMAGGDITYEASLVPNSIYKSGWELTRGDKELRTLAVVALMRSQQPVTMTAFGIVTLSYSNFIIVLRHSYSFFAVMY